MPAVLRYLAAARGAEGSFEQFRASLWQAADENAVAALDEAGAALGVAIANVIATVNPHVITIGGGLQQYVLAPSR